MATSWPIVSHRGLEGVFPRLPPVACFSELDTGYIFLCRVLMVVLLFTAKLISSENAFVLVSLTPLEKLPDNLKKLSTFFQMVKLCWAHGLYDAIFYVYNRGMRDYTTPLEVHLKCQNLRSCYNLQMNQWVYRKIVALNKTSQKM